ncbi:MAG: YCF48-related protein, partial [Bacteroidota bacterium]
DHGWAVGTCGIIARTTNGGMFWEVTEAPEGEDFNTVACAPGTGCQTVLMASDGLLARSTDGGTTWNIDESADWNGAETFHFLDASTVVLDYRSSKMGFSTDAGQSWTFNTIVGQSTTMQFFSATEGYYFNGLNQLTKTTDGGQTWTASAYTHPASIRKMAWFDLNTGWLLDQNRALFQTTDGGMNWTMVNQNDLPSNLTFMVAISATEVRGVQVTDRVYESNDGGTTWSSYSIDLGDGTFVKRNFHRRDDEFWLASNATEIYYSAAGFMNWESQFPAERSRVRAMAFSDESTGFAFMQGGNLLKTTDAGENWDVVNNVVFNPFNATILPSGELLAIVTNPKISADGGLTFTEYLSSDIASQITGISDFEILPSGRYYFIGSEAAAYSDDQGASWTVITHDISWTANDLYFLNDDLGFLAGTGGGRIARTTDGGLSWTDITDGSPTSQPLNRFYFTDENNGIVFGGSSSFRTSDGGDTWTSDSGVPGSYGVQKAPNGALYTVEFSSGNNGAAWRSTDDGATWQQFGYVCSPFRSSSITPNASYFFGGGDGGLIVRYDLDLINDVQTPETMMHSLQVYPNPTAGLLTFELPENASREVVLLEVFDLNGRAVLKERLNGYSSMQADISTQAPGIYIVQLSGEGWIQNGRIVLQR